MLSSDILEQQFGPTRLVILKQNTKLRLIETEVITTSQVLEVSMVDFGQVPSQFYPEIHSKILAGESMGKAFKAANIAFMRQAKSVSKCEVPRNLQHVFGSPEPATIVEVSIYVGPLKSHYCDILETYSPAVIWPGGITKKSYDVNAKLINLSTLLNKL